MAGGLGVVGVKSARIMVVLGGSFAMRLMSRTVGPVLMLAKLGAVGIVFSCFQLQPSFLQSCCSLHKEMVLL